MLRGGAQRWGLPLVSESSGAPGRGFLANLADALGGGLEKSIDPKSCCCPAGKRAGRGQGPVSGSLSECPASERHFLLVEPPGLLGCTVQEALCALLLLPSAGHWGCRNNSGHAIGEKDMSTELTQGAPEALGTLRAMRGLGGGEGGSNQIWAQGRLPGRGDI